MAVIALSGKIMDVDRLTFAIICHSLSEIVKSFRPGEAC